MKNIEGVVFVCSNCGNETTRWAGQCPACKEWNSLQEVKRQKSLLRQGYGRAGSLRRGYGGLGESPGAVNLAQVQIQKGERIKTGLGEVDRCLGGGFMRDEVVLLAGEPGIGKSTLLLQIAGSLAAGNTSRSILYVAGEESPSQIKNRADRLGIVSQGITVLPETQVESIVEYLGELRIKNEDLSVVIVDSVQTLESASLDSSAGSPAQVRESAQQLSQLAKRLGFVLILVGHVTKDGSIAGPKVLEHVVDAVLYLEGDSVHAFRLLRVTKNRFGSTDEVGVFAMGEKGFDEVLNPSALFLEGKLTNSPGSVICPVVSGNRCFLVEVQALTASTTFAMPRRTVGGVSLNRVLLILAVLQSKAGVNLSQHDVFVSVAGGLRVDDVGLDLAVALALISAFKQKSFGDKTAAFGEIGLSGEIRKVARAEGREKEAKKLGYTTFYSPETHRSVRELLTTNP